MTDNRVFVRDLKPYYAPHDLSELKGPVDGEVELRRCVFWAPGEPRIDLDEPGGIEMAYRVVITEGEVSDQVAVINLGHLHRVWQDLILPERARELWEERFPALRQLVTA